MSDAQRNFCNFSSNFCLILMLLQNNYYIKKIKDRGKEKDNKE